MSRFAAGLFCFVAACLLPVATSLKLENPPADRLALPASRFFSEDALPRSQPAPGGAKAPANFEDAPTEQGPGLESPPPAPGPTAGFALDADAAVSLGGSQPTSFDETISAVGDHVAETNQAQALAEAALGFTATPRQVAAAAQTPVPIPSLLNSLDKAHAAEAWLREENSVLMKQLAELQSAAAGGAKEQPVPPATPAGGAKKQPVPPATLAGPTGPANATADVAPGAGTTGSTKEFAANASAGVISTFSSRMAAATETIGALTVAACEAGGKAATDALAAAGSTLAPLILHWQVMACVVVGAVLMLEAFAHYHQTSSILGLAAARVLRPTAASTSAKKVYGSISEKLARWSGVAMATVEVSELQVGNLVVSGEVYVSLLVEGGAEVRTEAVNLSKDGLLRFRLAKNFDVCKFGGPLVLSVVELGPGGREQMAASLAIPAEEIMRLVKGEQRGSFHLAPPGAPWSSCQGQAIDEACGHDSRPYVCARFRLPTTKAAAPVRTSEAWHLSPAKTAAPPSSSRIGAALDIPAPRAWAKGKGKGKGLPSPASSVPTGVVDDED